MKNINAIVVALGSFVGWFIGKGDGFIYAMLTFVALDYLTGLMSAWVEKKLSSEVGAKGICKKVFIFILIGVGHVMDTYVIGDGEVLRTAVIFFYLANEGISILENAGRIGLPIPEKLKLVLAQLKEKSK